METGFTRVQRKHIKLAMRRLADRFNRGSFEYVCNLLEDIERDAEEPGIYLFEYRLSYLFKKFYDKESTLGIAWASKQYPHYDEDTPNGRKAMEQYKGFKILLLALFLEVGPNGIK